MVTIIGRLTRPPFLFFLDVITMTKMFAIISQEATQERELEYVWYVKTADPVALIQTLRQQATKTETQEQYQRLYDGFSERVRAVDNVGYSFTAKSWQEGIQGRDEFTMDINKATFEAYAEDVGQGWLKTRYFIPVDGHDLTYEVDVYASPRHEGGIHPWVKIDVEVKEALPTALTLPWTFDKTVQRGSVRDPNIDAAISDICQSWELPYEAIQSL